MRRLNFMHRGLIWFKLCELTEISIFVVLLAKGRQKLFLKSWVLIKKKIR
jgi:hypothetical protein